MHALIEKLLKKRGIERIEDLSPSEKETYDRWQKALSTEPITIEKLTDFIKEQKGKAENLITDADNSPQKDMFLKASLNIYRSLLGLVGSPEVEKKSLEEYLQQLLLE